MSRLSLAGFAFGLLMSIASAEEASVKEDASSKEDST
jgi:hypothetical protein